MKKRSTVLLFLLSASYLVMAQHAYRPFAATAASWEIEYLQGPNHIQYGSVTIPAGSGNDTIIGAQLYHKVNHSTNGYIGALRDDTASKHVYYYPKDFVAGILAL